MRRLRSLLQPIVAIVLATFVMGPVVAQAATTGLDDGSYLMEVTLEGGTGKASITSPAQVTLEHGVATAVIEWSSPNYDYMIVEGERYLPTNSGGNSTFEIPVSLVEPQEVIADTTAMSMPHEIAYRLTFDVESAQPATNGSGRQGLMVLLAVALLAATFVVLRR